MTSTFKSLKNQADDIFSRYDAHFAGKPRATRDLTLIDELILELEDLIDTAKSQLNGSRDPAMVSLLDKAKQNLDVYREEKKAIVEAKKGGPATADATRVVTLANLIFGRYHRHFAGQDRRTRDLGLLTEIIVELEQVQEMMKATAAKGDAGLESNLDVITQNLKMYRDEYRAIESAQKSGSPEEQADTLATLANNQFQLYRHHFAGKPRHTRRPGLLERMISQLKRIHKSMHSLKKGGLSSQGNDKNIDIVAKNLKVYQGELEQVRKARQGLETEQLVGALGAAANEVMGEYRQDFAGENRATRDLDQLRLLCDRMSDIFAQMRAIQRDEPTEINGKNLEIVLDALTMYESEYRRVEEAKSS